MAYVLLGLVGPRCSVLHFATLNGNSHLNGNSQKCEEFFEEKWMVVSQESGEIQMSSVLKKTKTRRLDGSDKSH